MRLRGRVERKGCCKTIQPRLCPGLHRPSVACCDPRPEAGAEIIGPTSPLFGGRQKHRTHGRRRGGEHSRRLEPTVAAVDATHQQRVRVLVGDDQVIAVGVEREMSRRLAARALLFDVRQRARVAVDLEQHDAVVAAVRGIEVPARGVDGDLGRRVLARRSSPGSVERVCSSCEGALFRVVGEGRDGRVEFVEDVGEACRRGRNAMCRGRRRVSVS